MAGSGFVTAILTKLLNRPLPKIKPSPTTPPPSEKPSPISPPPSEISVQKFPIVTVNSRGEIISSRSRQGQAEVVIEDLDNGVTLEMVKIPAGIFVMGSPETEAERDSSESPQHNVCLLYTSPSPRDA